MSSQWTVGVRAYESFAIKNASQETGVPLRANIQTATFGNGEAVTVATTVQYISEITPHEH